VGCTCTSAITPLADVAERAEVPAVEVHDAGVERVRIEVVIENEIHDPHATLAEEAKQERPAFAAGRRPPFPQFRGQVLPEKPRTRQLMPRCLQARNNLRN
jgi:hypothetical protein